MPRGKQGQRTRWQRRRDEQLAAAGLSKADVYRRLVADGFGYSTGTVKAVLAGRFRNVDVESAFCALTGVDVDTAFPLDEPPYGRAVPTRRNYTSARAARATQTAPPVAGTTPLDSHAARPTRAPRK